VGILEKAGDDEALERARLGLAAARGKISIGAVHAKLIFEKGGGTSDCLFENADLSRGLWNTIIGEGSAGSSSTSTLLQVEVFGPPGAGGTLEVEARDSGKKPLLKESVKIDKLDDQGHGIFELTVKNTGCDTLKIKAKLGDSSLSEAVPFNCGE
jgi:hypothetical protein